VYLLSNGALDWGPVRRTLHRSPMVSDERTTTTTIKRVGLDGREAPATDEAA
jgi:NADH-quinone oxidoreductase subunit A